MPSRLLGRVIGVLLLQPRSPSAEAPFRISVECLAPGFLVEPLARILGAGMIAGHRAAERFFQVAHQSCQTFGSVTPILGRGHYETGVLLRPHVPDHHVFGVCFTPPGRRRRPDARQQEGLRIGIEHPLALGVYAGPIHRFPGRWPRETHRETHEIDAHVGRQLDLLPERTRRPSQIDEGLTGTIERDREIPRRLGPSPKADTVSASFSQTEFGVVINVEVGPPAVRRGFEVDLKPPGSITTASRFDLDGAYGVLRSRRPERPAAVEIVDSLFVLLPRDDVLPGAYLHDVDVVEADRARRRAEPEMHRR